MNQEDHMSEHFRIKDFGCHDGTPYPEEWIEDRLKPLCLLLEKIRIRAGNHPITINSGYRTIAYDTALYEKSKKDGSVAPPTSSQHPKGRAADIKHATFHPSELFNLTLQMYEDGEIPELGGIGLYPTFVHVDTRPKTGVHLAIWGGARPDNVA
jgi:uncharacterized protein YcbK (DUF882 family)